MRRPMLVLLAALLPLAGCAAIPTETQPKPIGPAPSKQSAASASEPSRDIDPLTLVREFVEASSNPDGDYAAARAYLTDAAEKKWETRSRMIIEQNFSTVPTSQLPTDKQQTVLLQGKNVGRLQPDSSFVPLMSDLNRPIRTERNSEGQWRISEPPDGVYVPFNGFNINYKRVMLYFYNPEFTVLVPDTRYVVVSPSTSIPQRVSELLVRGPSEGMRGALFSALGDRASLHQDTKEADDGALEVNLAQLGDLTPQDRKLIVAQVVKSLAGVTSSRIRVLVEGVPLSPDQQEWRPADVNSGESLITPNADQRGMLVNGGQVRSLADGNPVRGPAGTGEYNALSAAQSLDGSQLAVVGRQGAAVRLRVGQTEGELSAVDLPATTLTRPTWLLSSGPREPSKEVWTVADGTKVARVIRNDRGEWMAGAVNATELSGFGQVTDLRLARDGTRVGMVVGGKLYVAAVVRDSQDGSVSIRAPRQLQPALLGTTVQSLDWLSQDVLVVASSLPSYPIVRVYADGSKVERYNTSNLTVPVSSVAAAVSCPVVAVDRSGLWTATDIGDVWRANSTVKIDFGAVVFYPG